MTCSPDPDPSADSANPQRIIRCESTEDFLAALPQLTGFSAEESVFIVLFTGNRTRGAIRVDLPGDDEPATLMNFLDAVCELLESPSDNASPAFVITTSESFASAAGAPRRELAQALLSRLFREGYRAREVCCVAPDGWTSYLHSDDPHRPQPLTRVLRSSVASPPELLPDLQSLANLPWVSPMRRAAVRGEIAHTELPGPGSAPPHSPGPGYHEDERTPEEERLDWIRETTAAFEDAMRLGPTHLAFEDCARLIRYSESPPHWLLMALTAITHEGWVVGMARSIGAEPFADVSVTAHDDAEGQQRSDTVTSSPTWSIENLITRVSVSAPEHERLQAAIGTAMVLAAYAPAGMQAGFLSLASWLWWLSGLQTVAIRLIERAHDAHPDHEVTRIVRTVVKEQVAPRFQRATGERDE